MELVREGTQAALIKSLMAGDMIEVVPRAEYRYWTNVVSEVTIEVHYEAGQQLPMASLMTPLAFQHPIYSPIDSQAGEIRVLVLQPGDFDTPIVCQLVTICTSDPNKLKFEAVSYCWGDQSEQHDIILHHNCSENVVSIARSTAHMLRYLRYPRQERVLWVDALCINQADVEERAEQVVKMASIYASAEKVAVFLGAEDKVMRLGFQVVRATHNHKNSVCAGDGFCSCQGTPHILTPEEVAASVTVGEKAGHNWMSAITWAVRDSEPGRHNDPEIFHHTPSHHVLMAYVFSSPYFSRVWVLQEVFNAKRAIIYSGKESVTWPELLEVHDYSASDRLIAHLEPIRRLPPIWMELKKQDTVAVPPTNEAPENVPQKEQIMRPPMLEVFLDSLELDASDARDKIFAMLSFGDETHDSATIPDLIRPNYKKSLEEVFADFTRWWIIRHESLGILSALHGQVGRTWQNMTSSDNPISHIPGTTWSLGTEGRAAWAKATLHARSCYHAAGTTKPSIELICKGDSKDRFVLRLRGVKLTTIQHKSCFPLELANTHGFRELFQAYCYIFDPAGVEGWWKGIRMPSEHKQEKQRELDDWLFVHWQCHWNNGERAAISVIDPVGDISRYTGCHRMERNVLPCHGECFFKANNGRYGLCPPTAKKDDVVAVLQGGDVPFLLRPLDAHGSSGCRYQLVGECFFDGYMQGEAFDRALPVEVLEIV